METAAKALVVAVAAGVLLCATYVGVRTTSEPVWFVRWRNKLNGDPRDYPSEFQNQWWARWNLELWNPDRVRIVQMRIFGAVIAVVSISLLVGLLAFAY